VIPLEESLPDDGSGYDNGNGIGSAEYYTMNEHSDGGSSDLRSWRTNNTFLIRPSFGAAPRIKLQLRQYRHREL